MELTNVVLKDFWAKAIDFVAYKNLLDTLMSAGKTTGGDQSEAMVAYAKLNLQRMKRVAKTTVLNDYFSRLPENFEAQKWLILTEGWCGDAAQITPVLEKIAKNSAGKIEIRYLLRDENLTLMDHFLTNGGRAIPKLIVLNDAFEVMANWGPRPPAAQALVNAAKTEGLAYEDWSERLHKWYSDDKTVDIQSDIELLLKNL